MVPRADEDLRYRGPVRLPLDHLSPHRAIRRDVDLTQTDALRRKSSPNGNRGSIGSCRFDRSHNGSLSPPLFDRQLWRTPAHRHWQRWREGAPRRCPPRERLTLSTSSIRTGGRAPCGFPSGGTRSALVTLAARSDRDTPTCWRGCFTRSQRAGPPRCLWSRRRRPILAAAVSTISGVPIAAGALKRVKATSQQVGLSRSERAANVQGAFRVPPEGKPAVVGRRLVLIDDVLTSGVTVEGCARRSPAPALSMSMCWCSPGLPIPCERPYKGLIELTNRYDFCRNLHYPRLPLLPLGEGTAFAQGHQLS